ncbi:hypothetical protein [Aurantiacibacter hainanensis]|uniref:hypothetical protein n=1 Tax=Aurantiacibacter hainanensis TaxID=3076114 RepID=UPI0030C6A54B
MGMLPKLAIATAVATFGLAQPAVAQDGEDLSSRQVSLYSEMWALAGVCNQLVGYDVRQDDLADFLNDSLASAVDEDQIAIAQTRDERLAAIRAEVERLESLPRGSRRQREVDENAENLMSRCTRLANDDTAGEFFVRIS